MIRMVRDIRAVNKYIIGLMVPRLIGNLLSAGPGRAGNKRKKIRKQKTRT